MLLKKLTEAQRKDIKDSYKKGESIYSIAKRYQRFYSKRVISLFLQPKKHEAHKRYQRLSWKKRNK